MRGGGAWLVRAARTYPSDLKTPEHRSGVSSRQLYPRAPTPLATWALGILGEEGESKGIFSVPQHHAVTVTLLAPVPGLSNGC